MQREPAMAFDEALGTLRQFRGSRRPASRAVKHCELCGVELHSEHPHLVELVSRQMVCACEACAMLFDGLERSKFKRVSRSIRFLPDFKMTDAQWDSLIIPINLAFFFHSSLEQRVIAMYPSPAGAIESLLTLDAWNDITEANPVLRRIESDIEALLVKRINRPDNLGPPEYYVAPIDECYRLVGLIRAHWKGLSGGAEVWREIDRFFAGLRSRADVLTGGADA